LNEDEQLGIDWSDLFRSNGGQGSFGVAGNTSGAGQGFFFDLVTPDIEIALSALQDEGRLQTLSTPKLVALENEEASVVVGDRRGYQVTTTINQVTTESIEFLESGVILRVLAQIDDDGRVLMRVHPEVSTGTVDANGIPSQTTTEVTTNILVPSGETIFIGGLMKQTESTRRRSVPVVNRVPLVRRLFSGTESAQLTTETIVLIRPIIAEDLQESWNVKEIETTEQIDIPMPALEPWVRQKSVSTTPVEGRSIDAPSNALLAGTSHNVESVCGPSELLFCYASHCACEHAP
jgi:type II secretory pathway component GspD/PulD (secretin)